MIHHSIKLEVLARDLASRYGEHDAMVQSVRSAIAAQPPAHAVAASERRLQQRGPSARRFSQRLQAQR